jgi:FkbM family methyltransferase
MKWFVGKYAYKYKKYTNKIERKLKIQIFLIFSPFRLMCLLFEIFLFKKLNLDKKNVKFFGGYYFSNKNFNSKKLNIISAGIGDNVIFEKYLEKNYKITNLICIDPTEVAKKTLKKNLKKYKFYKAALTDKKKIGRIFVPYFKEDINYSVGNIIQSKNSIKINFLDIITVMKKNKMKQIDMLKLDVEGVADKVIFNCFKKSIYPNQICLELERPIFFDQIYFFKTLLKFKSLVGKYYDIFYYTKKKRGQRIELLCIKK